MSDATTIKINPGKNSDLEFDVMIQGLDQADLPIVKFVITSEAAGCDYAFRCVKVDAADDQTAKHRWLAKLPALAHIKENQVKFHVEVIVDGYYFEAAAGFVTLVTDPSVKFQPSVSKPTVTTSFTVKQDIEEQSPPIDAVIQTVDPQVAAIEPEEPLAFAVDSDAVADGHEDPTFDPRTVAESIIRSTIGGSVERPAVPGSFFKRRSDGSPIVNGIDTPSERAAKKLNAEKVREILGT